MYVEQSIFALRRESHIDFRTQYVMMMHRGGGAGGAGVPIMTL